MFALDYAFWKVLFHNCNIEGLFVTLESGMSEPPLNTTDRRSSFIGRAVTSSSNIPSRSPRGALIVILLVNGYDKYSILIFES